MSRTIRALALSGLTGVLLVGTALAQTSPPMPPPRPAGLTPSFPPAPPAALAPVAQSGQPLVNLAPTQDLLTAAAPATNAATPRIQFAETLFDFGRVKSGETVKHDFIFTNAGNATLEITAVQPTCGCTAAGEWTRKVEPGQTGTIPLQFNSTSFVGPVHKTVPVVNNDKSQPTVVLQMKANVWRPVDVLPQFAMLNIPADMTTASTEVKIINNTEVPLTLGQPETNNPAFTAELRTNQPGKDYTVKISVVPPLPAGNAQGLVSLKTSHSNFPVVHITAWANITPAIMVMPPMISLPAAPLAGRAMPTIIVQNNSTNALKLSEPTVSVAGIEPKITEVSPGRMFNISMTFPEGFEVPQGQQAVLTVKSSNPKQPALTIPITQQPRRPGTPPVATPAPPPPGVPTAARQS